MNQQKTRKPLPGSEAFESLGKTWHLAPLGPAIQDAYSAWCRMRARRNTDRDKALMTPEEYAEEKQAVKRQIDAGEYEWGPPVEMQGTGMAPGVAALFNSNAGRLHMLRLLLEPAHDEMSDEEIDALVADGAESLKEAFHAVFFSRYPWLRPVEPEAKTAEEYAASLMPSGPAPTTNPDGATPTA
jgi:hypothetical protein